MIVSQYCRLNEVDGFTCSLVYNVASYMVSCEYD